MVKDAIHHIEPGMPIILHESRRRQRGFVQAEGGLDVVPVLVKPNKQQTYRGRQRVWRSLGTSSIFNNGWRGSVTEGTLIATDIRGVAKPKGRLRRGPRQ